MSHTVTGKLNKPARQHPNANGVTFFVSLGEKNYNYQTKQNEWTNYDAALFAKDAQIQFYTENLVEGAIVSVSGSGLLLDVSNAQYPKLNIQESKLAFVSSGQAPAQRKVAPQQYNQAPQQQGGFNQQPQQQQAPQGFKPQTPAPQQAPQNNGHLYNQAPQQQAPVVDFDDDLAF